MPVHATSIPGLLRIAWKAIEDERGFFKHSYQVGELVNALGRQPLLKQGNHSRSRSNVLRGFHVEPWDKLVYVPRGQVLFVVADVRPESSTFGAWESFVLGDPPGRYDRVYVERGLANAFYCYSETDYLNDVSEEFDAQDRAGVIWNDPTLSVNWPSLTPILSNADRAWPSLKELFPTHPIFAP